MSFSLLVVELRLSILATFSIWATQSVRCIVVSWVRQSAIWSTLGLALALSLPRNRPSRVRVQEIRRTTSPFPSVQTQTQGLPTLLLYGPTQAMGFMPIATLA